MSGSILPADVTLHVRTGQRRSLKRARSFIGSATRFWIDVIDTLTGNPVPGATGAAGLYWLPEIEGQESPAQPLEPNEVKPGTWAMDVPGDYPGTARGRFQIEGPVSKAVEFFLDVTTEGRLVLSGVRVAEYSDVLAMAAAAGDSAARAAARSLVPGLAGPAAIAAIQPFVDGVFASEEIALGAADIAVEKAGQTTADRAATGRSAADAEAARVAAAQRSADAALSAAGAFADAVKASLSAAQAAAASGGGPYDTVAAGLAAVAESASFNVVGSGDIALITYRKTGGNAVYLTQVAAPSAFAAIPGRLGAAIGDYVLSWEALGNLFGGIRDQGRRLEAAGQFLALLTDGRARWGRTSGGLGLTLADDALEVDGTRIRFRGAQEDGLLWSMEADRQAFVGVKDAGREFFVAGQRFVLQSDGALRWTALAGGAYLDLTPSGIVTSGNSLQLSGLRMTAGSVVGAFMEAHYPGGGFSAFGIDPVTGVPQLLGRTPLSEMIGEAPAPDEIHDINPLFAGNLYLLPGKPLPLYPSMLFARRADSKKARVSISSGSYSVSGSEQILIDPARMEATGVLDIVRKDIATESRTRIGLTVKVAALAAQAPRILMIGDSIANRSLGSLINTRLTGLGLFPTWIGSINTTGLDASVSNTSGPRGEAREGRAFADLVYSVLDGEAAPIVPGQEAAYLALAKTNRLAFNPFLRQATGADPAGLIRNGYVFDMAFYLARFGYETPDIVLCGLGENDASEQVSPAVEATVADAVDILMAQTRAALPSARIGFFLSGQASSTSGDARWTERKVPVLRTIMQTVRVKADPLAGVISAWAHQTPDAGWPAYDTADPVTGILTSDIADAVHPSGVARAQLADAVAAFIACNS
jgi:lysophospholipase L1-like esterase